MKEGNPCLDKTDEVAVSVVAAAAVLGRARSFIAGNKQLVLRAQMR